MCMACIYIYTYMYAYIYTYMYVYIYTYVYDVYGVCICMVYEYCLVEAKKQLDDKEVYQELRGHVESPLEKIIKKVIRKLRNRGDISHETLDYLSVNNPKLGRFHLLPKIHKRLHDVEGRPVI